jgi:hypothetical protein
MTQLSDIELKEAVSAVDFSMIINKMVAHQGWNHDDANEVCRLYRNWLFLSIKYPDKSLPPSEDVDEFWHNHILDTKKYRVDCDMLFGKYLDHYPYFGIDATSTMTDLGNAFADTQALHFAEFGEYIYEVRNQPVKRLVSFLKRLFGVGIRRQQQGA